MEYPRLYQIITIGDPETVGIYVGYDEVEALEETATKAGLAFDDVKLIDHGDVSQCPVFIMVMDYV